MRNVPENLLVFLIAIHVLQISAGPTQRPDRIIREIYPEIVETTNREDVCIVGDVVYGVDERVPADQPCLRCFCQPPGVHCEALRCERKPGCKPIHKPNNCCPDYQCECERDGHRYANGERLESPPGGECKVCYCRGGEIQCANVTCYVRSDCEGRTVPGTCCPKYDHCPPREPLRYNVNQDVTSENEIVSRPITPTPLDEDTTYSSEITNGIQDRSDTILNDGHITIQEIIPAIKEIPITESAAEDLEPSPPDNESDSSEISQVYYPPPPVIKIGNQFLVLNKGELVPGKGLSTPQSVITIMGAEGLQRGDEDNVGNDEDEEVAASTHILSLVKPKHHETTTTKEMSKVTMAQSTETIEMDPSTALMTEAIINKIKRITNVETTTDVAHLLEQIYVADIGEEKPLEVNETRGKEQNPAYPPIPDVMSPVDDVVERTDAELAQIAKTNFKELESPLINQNLSLPEELLKSPAHSDFIDIFENSTMLITTGENEETQRESLETPLEDDSGETITSKNLPSIQAFVVENASVENSPKSSQEVDVVSKENRAAEELDDSKEINVQSRNASESIEADVELIDSKLIVENLNSKENVTNLKTYNSTKIILHKDNSSTIETTTRANATKREVINSTTPTMDKKVSADEEVFRELNEELASVRPRVELTDENSDAIFKELLEDATTTPKEDKEKEMMQKVSDTITRYRGKDARSSLDSSIMGILKEFFGAQ